MPYKQVLIAHAYYFLCEMIILFLLVFPIFHHYYLWIPYASYLFILGLSCIIFSYIAYKNVNVFWIWLILPFLWVIFSAFDYPLMFTIILPFLFVMDYAIIHKQGLMGREALYIILGIIISAINFLIMNTWSFFGYFLLLILVVFTGYAVSHIAVMDKQARKYFQYRLFFYFIAILTVSAAVFFLFATVIKRSGLFIWYLLTDIFTGSLKGLSIGVGYIFSGDWKRGWPEQKDTGGSPAYTGERRDEVSGQYIMDYVYPSIIMAVGLVLLSVAILLIIMYIKNRKKKVTYTGRRPERSSYQLQYDTADVMQKTTRSYFRTLKQPEHPIRKLVFRFERKAEKHKKGRKPFETVGEWLKRIGMDDELAIYQQVRYGDARDVSEEETERLKSRLKKLQDELGKV